MSHMTSIRSPRIQAAVLTVQALLAVTFAEAQDAVEVEHDTVFLISNGVPAMPLGLPQLGAVSIVGSDAGTVVEGKPYSADAVTTTTQQLADGNRIVHSNEIRVYRDSEGRTRREQRLSSPGFFEFPGPGGSVITINDPVARASFMLDPTAETARRLPSFDVANAPVAAAHVSRSLRLADAPAAAGEPDAGEAGAEHGFNVVVESFTAPVPAPPEGRARGAVGGAAFFRTAPTVLGELGTRTEDLGEQVLQGVRAHGTRITRTIPAGAIGNEREIEIVSETWYSPELAVDVLRRNLDPRTGETVYELVNIDRNEPPADLFSVPSGYEVLSGTGPIEFELRREPEWRSTE